MQVLISVKKSHLNFYRHDMTLNARASCPLSSPSFLTTPGQASGDHLRTTWWPLDDVEVLISVKKHTYTFTDMTWRSLPPPLPLLPDDPWRGIVGGFGSVRHVASFEKALSFKLPFAWICQKLKIKSLVGLQWCSFLPLTNCTSRLPSVPFLFHTSGISQPSRIGFVGHKSYSVNKQNLLFWLENYLLQDGRHGDKKVLVRLKLPGSEYESTPVGQNKLIWWEGFLI